MTLVLATLAACGATFQAAVEQHLPIVGVVVDQRGPPPNTNFTLVETLTLDGVDKPKRLVISCGGWGARVTEGDLFQRRTLGGFEARKVGETLIELTRYQTRDGVWHRIRQIEYSSPDLPWSQLPKVTNPPERKL